MRSAMKLNNESKTLFIPLLGKAIMSKQGLFLKDKKAEEIVSKIEHDFKSLKQSKWLSMYMSLRALIIDELCNKYISNNPNLTIIHLGCGLDSRCLRIKGDYNIWYDIDYESVIKLRNKFYETNPRYKMIGSSVLDYEWLNKINDSQNILVVAEGLTMYLEKEEIKELVYQINKRFKNVYLIFDAYTHKGVKGSRIKNPVNKMKAKIKYGFDNPEEFLLLNTNLRHIKTHSIRKEKNNLKGLTKFIFNNLYCSKIADSLYKIYEYDLKSRD
jgi:O-methyltransferase involved in polyketide biosynthesis